jgi:hypothetical protein
LRLPEHGLYHYNQQQSGNNEHENHIQRVELSLCFFFFPNGAHTIETESILFIGAFGSVWKYGVRKRKKTSKKTPTAFPPASRDSRKNAAEEFFASRGSAKKADSERGYGFFG